jgi:type II secretory pathway pseudopilin PulG
MDPIGILVLVIFLILIAVAAIVPSMQRRRAEKKGQAEGDS